MPKGNTDMRKSKSFAYLHTLIIAMFSDNHSYLTKLLEEIHEAQNRETSSPNFFYDGTLYRADRVNAIKPLVMSQRDSMRYLVIAKAQYNDSRYQLFNLLTSYMTPNRAKHDLFIVLPKGAHRFIMDDPPLFDEDYIKDNTPDSIDEIQELINEQLLFSLIT